MPKRNKKFGWTTDSIDVSSMMKWNVNGLPDGWTSWVQLRSYPEHVCLHLNIVRPNGIMSSHLVRFPSLMEVIEHAEKTIAKQIDEYSDSEHDEKNMRDDDSEHDEKNMRDEDERDLKFDFSQRFSWPRNRELLEMRLPKATSSADYKMIILQSLGTLTDEDKTLWWIIDEYEGTVMYAGPNELVGRIHAYNSGYLTNSFGLIEHVRKNHFELMERIKFMGHWVEGPLLRQVLANENRKVHLKTELEREAKAIESNTVKSDE